MALLAHDQPRPCPGHAQWGRSIDWAIAKSSNASCILPRARSSSCVNLLDLRCRAAASAKSLFVDGMAASRVKSSGSSEAKLQRN